MIPVYGTTVQEAKALQAAEDHRRKEIERRMHPRTAADFEILYNELEAWRLQVCMNTV
jgi:hypothetical protein